MKISSYFMHSQHFYIFIADLKANRRTWLLPLFTEEPRERFSPLPVKFCHGLKDIELRTDEPRVTIVCSTKLPLRHQQKSCMLH